MKKEGVLDVGGRIIVVGRFKAIGTALSTSLGLMVLGLNNLQRCMCCHAGMTLEIADTFL